MARTQRNSNYRRKDEYQSDRGDPVWLLFFIDGVGNRGRLQMGHELGESWQHRNSISHQRRSSQLSVTIRLSSNERRSGRGQLLHGKLERPYSGYDLLLSGLCQGPGDGGQVFFGPDLHRRCEPVHDGVGGGRRIAGTPGQEVRVHIFRLRNWHVPQLQLLLRHRTLRLPLGGISADQEPHSRLSVDQQHHSFQGPGGELLLEGGPEGEVERQNRHRCLRHRFLVRA